MANQTPLPPPKGQLYPPPPPPNYPSPIAPPRLIRPTGPMVVFQFSLLVLFGLVSLWVSFGRAFLGAGGWFMLIMLPTVTPIIAVYGLTVGLIAIARYSSDGYVLKRWTAASYFSTLLCLLIAGFTIVDFGDTEDSVGSVLTHALNAQPGDLVWTISVAAAWISLGLAAVLMVVSPVLMIFEGRKSKQLIPGS